MYFVVIRYSCDLNPLKPVKYVLCWMIPTFFFFNYYYYYFQVLVGFFVVVVVLGYFVCFCFFVCLFDYFLFCFVLFCWVFFFSFFPRFYLAVFKDRYLSGALCIATTEKENREWGMERKNTNFHIRYWFLWFAEGSCCGFYMEAVGGEDGENEEANSGTVVPCKFLPIHPRLSAQWNLGADSDFSCSQRIGSLDLWPF